MYIYIYTCTFLLALEWKLLIDKKYQSVLFILIANFDLEIDYINLVRIFKAYIR